VVAPRQQADPRSLIRKSRTVARFSYRSVVSTNTWYSRSLEPSSWIAKAVPGSEIERLFAGGKDFRAVVPKGDGPARETPT
jgi:hypothetical protein